MYARKDPNSFCVSVCTLAIWLRWDWSTRSGSGQSPHRTGDDSRDEEEFVLLVFWTGTF